MMEALAAADVRVASQNTALVEGGAGEDLERVVTELVIRLGQPEEELGILDSSMETFGRGRQHEG